MQQPELKGGRLSARNGSEKLKKKVSHKVPTDHSKAE